MMILLRENIDSQVIKETEEEIVTKKTEVMREISRRKEQVSVIGVHMRCFVGKAFLRRN